MMVEIIGMGFCLLIEVMFNLLGIIVVFLLSVVVYFGSEFVWKVQVILEICIFVVMLEYDEGDVEVIVQNIDDNGDDILGEIFLILVGFFFWLLQFYVESEFVMLIWLLFQLLKWQIYLNVQFMVYIDFDDIIEDVFSIIKVVLVFVFVICGLLLIENWFYMVN